MLGDAFVQIPSESVIIIYICEISREISAALDQWNSLAVLPVQLLDARDASADMVNVHASDVQRANASGPRNFPKRGRHQNSGNYVVSPDPVSNDGFCWERVLACQCVAYEKYGLEEECPERTHFVKWVSAALKAANTATNAPRSDLLSAVCDAIAQTCEEDDPDAALQEVLKITTVSYGQLVLKRHPPLDSREPPANSPDYVPDVYEMYKVKETVNNKEQELNYVQAPRSEVRGGSGSTRSYSSQKRTQPLQPSHKPHGTDSDAHVATTV